MNMLTYRAREYKHTPTKKKKSCKKCMKTTKIKRNPEMRQKA